MPKKSKTPPPPRRSFGRRVLTGLLITGTTAVVLIIIVYGVWAATFDLEKVGQIPERSAVYDMDGNFYSRLAGQNRVVVPLSRVSKHFTKALLAREDTRFYKHMGVDPIGILRAIVRNLTHLSIKEGASTLTQQLARNSFYLGEGLHRKVLEAFLALRIEQNFTKDQILEAYVNRIYFGHDFWGVEMASQSYFGKPAGKLNLSESAMLVGLIRSPNRFSPINDFKKSLRERDSVLERMQKLGMLNQPEVDAAERTRIKVKDRTGPYPQQNFAMDTVVRDLEILLRDDTLEEGGLKIYTTIDPRLQKAAHNAVDNRLAEIEKRSGYSHSKKADFDPDAKKREERPDYLQGAAMVFDNRTGGIRAIVGGRDYSESKYNRALLAERQVGSTFKPFVYAAAFDRGLSPGEPVDDGPIRRGELRTVSGNWSPANSDGKFNGPMPAAEGLIRSRNTMTVRVGNKAGFNAVQDMARAVGLGDVPANPAVFLGAFESNLKDLTVAYSVFPNNGVRKQPYIIERIDDTLGNVLYRAAHVEARVMAPKTALLVSSVLQDVINRGTAASARRLGFRNSAGGKTGTTNDYRDAWFVGYTSSLTCGVWVGLDKPETIMSRGYGSTLALPIWVDILKSASSQRYPTNNLPRVETAPRASRPSREDGGPSFPERVLDSFRNFFRR